MWTMPSAAAVAITFANDALSNNDDDDDDELLLSW